MFGSGGCRLERLGDILSRVAAVLAYVVMHRSLLGWTLVNFWRGRAYLVCIWLQPSGGGGALQGKTCLDLVATVFRQVLCYNSSTGGHSWLIDSNTRLLEAFCLFIMYLDTITSDEFGISTFVILTLHNVHDYFALAMVNNSCMLLFCTYSYITGTHTWWVT